jgi:hypothetical protein
VRSDRTDEVIFSGHSKADVGRSSTYSVDRIGFVAGVIGVFGNCSNVMGSGVEVEVCKNKYML